MFGIIDHFQKVYMGKSNNNPNIEKSTFFSKSITQNIEFFKQSFQNSADLSVRYLNISGTQSAIITISGLVDKNVLTQSVVNPIIFCEISIENSVEKYKYIKDNIISSVDQTEVSTLEDAINAIASGNAIFAMDGCDVMSFDSMFPIITPLSSVCTKS